MSLKMHPTFKKAVEFHKKGDLVNAKRILIDIKKVYLVNAQLYEVSN